MAMDNYEGPGEVYFDNRIMGEANRVRFNVRGNNSKVHNFRKGLAGRSKGATETEITVEQAVPKRGMQAPFVKKCVDNANVKIVIVFGGERYSYDGWIEDCDGSNGTSEAASFNFTVHAGKPDIR